MPGSHPSPQRRRIDGLYCHLVAAEEATSTRDWTGELTYYLPDAPTETVKDTWGEWDGVIPVGGGNHFNDPERRRKMFETKKMTVVDARTHMEGGLDAWSFEDHGFCYLQRPSFPFPEHLVQDRKKVDREFGPKIVEAAKKAVGAKHAFWCSHQRRSENGDFAARYDDFIFRKNDTHQSHMHSDQSNDYHTRKQVCSGGLSHRLRARL